jgi:hypothetical protein
VYVVTGTPLNESIGSSTLENASWLLSADDHSLDHISGCLLSVLISTCVCRMMNGSIHPHRHSASRDGHVPDPGLESVYRVCEN